jgi:membrane-associated protein
VIHSALIPWLSPYALLHDFGSFAVLGVCVVIFVEIAFLIGFLLPGDTLLLITGLLSFPTPPDAHGHDTQLIHLPIVLVALSIGLAAFLGGELGHYIGRKAGPRIFERKETGLFSRENVERTNKFFVRFGGFAIIVACFVPVIRTFAPVAAGVGHMRYQRYGLFNLIGAFLWAFVITIGGYLLGYIPPVAHFVTRYIDVILLAAILVAVVPTVYHYVQASRRSRKSASASSAS